jgi:hypothetical protein
MKCNINKASKAIKVQVIKTKTHKLKKMLVYYLHHNISIHNSLNFNIQQ